MNARKLLVASALSVLSAPVHASPAVDACRVTGNVVTGQGKGPGDTCRLDERTTLPLANATVDPEAPSTCSVEGRVVDEGGACEIELPSGEARKLPIVEEKRS